MEYSILIPLTGITIICFLAGALGLYRFSRKKARTAPESGCPGSTAGKSKLVSLKKEAAAPPASQKKAELVIDHEIPEPEDEHAFLYEEYAMSNQATSIIRKSNHLLRLHLLRTNPELTGSTPPKKQRQQVLPSIDAEELHREILRKLENEGVHLNEELSIAAFAHELGIEPYQLSRFLNVRLHTTYTDLISSYRVCEAKKLLLDNPDGLILDIAFSSGFNSKASFNRTFKRSTGMTPSEYRLKTKPSGSGDSL